MKDKSDIRNAADEASHFVILINVNLIFLNSSDQMSDFQIHCKIDKCFTVPPKLRLSLSFIALGLHLLTLMSSQTCMTFFLLWNPKEDTLKNVLVFFVHTLKVSGVQGCFGHPTFTAWTKNLFFRISYFVDTDERKSYRFICSETKTEFLFLSSIHHTLYRFV